MKARGNSHSGLRNGDKTASISISTARNILDLDSEMQKMYKGQRGSIKIGHSTGQGFARRMNCMVRNMQKKLESRFDPAQHRVQNEQILLQMRVKQQNKNTEEAEYTADSRENVLALQQIDGQMLSKKELQQLGANSSGLIKEVSQESDLNSGYQKNVSLTSLPKDGQDASHRLLPETKTVPGADKSATKHISANAYNLNTKGDEKIKMDSKNLTAYNSNHLKVQANPRTLLADKGRKRIEAPTWERVIPGSVTKPKSIEE